MLIYPEGSDAEEPDGILFEPEEQQEGDEDDEEDNIFATWMGRYKKAAEQEDKDKEVEKRGSDRGEEEQLRTTSSTTGRPAAITTLSSESVYM